MGSPTLDLIAEDDDAPYAAPPIIEVARVPNSADPSLTRGALLPLGIVVAIALYYGLDAPFGLVAFAIAPFGILFVFAPFWARRSTRGFDRDAILLMHNQDHEGLQRRFSRAWAMRLFASPAVVAERQARIAAEAGDTEKSYQYYERALRGYGGEPPIGIEVGFAHACFLTDRDEGAIEIYERLLERGQNLPLIAERLEIAKKRAKKKLVPINKKRRKSRK